MKITLCFQFDGAVMHTDACDSIEKDCFNDKQLEKYAENYGADAFSYYLDQPNCDDGWVCTRAYVSFYFNGVKSDNCEELLDKIDDGSEISEIIEDLGHKNTYWFDDIEDDD
jgi:hypothetical protein